MRVPRYALHLFLLFVFAATAWAAGCAATAVKTGTGGAGGGMGGATSSHSSTTSGVMLDAGQGGGTCTGTGRVCQIHNCPGNLRTTISGTIYDPHGKNPLYGVVAYVPNTTPDPITPGTSCYTCDELYTGDPIAGALTDASGHFTIKDAPDGPNIPLVIQIGKWRRQFVIPNVGLCADTALPDGMLRLPRNSSEGDLPNIAVATGAADTFECLLVRMGVDKSEFVPGPSTAGHVHIFPTSPQAPNTNPAAPPPENALWDTSVDIMKYDIVLLSCEGYETINMNQQALFDFAAAGGRVFASHLHYAWFYTGPFSTKNLATWLPGANYLGDINATVVNTTWGGKPFVRGQAMHDWLLNVKALTNDTLPIVAARHNADVSVINSPSQPWLTLQGNPTAPQDFTFDTPLGADAGAQCGRVVYSDMHVGACSHDYNGTNMGTTPDGCVDLDLCPQEKALEFILFDLSSCVTPDNAPQTAPGTK